MKLSYSVRDFAQPVPRHGSIDVHSGLGLANTQGQAVHELIQSERSSVFYKAEFPLAWEFKREEFVFAVSGRADGLFLSPLKIEEIKSTFDLKGLIAALKSTQFHPYILQLAVYQDLYQRIHGLKPEAFLHLVCLRNGARVEMDLPLDTQHYEEWLERRLDQAVIEARKQIKISKRRSTAAKVMSFPFETVRMGQSELMARVEESITKKIPLLVQAPTGLGKTMAVFLPMVKEAFGRGERLIYVTPKNSQHQVAEDAVERLQKTGAKFKSLTLTAKNKLCLKEEVLCRPDYCEYAKDHFTKLTENKVVEEALRKKKLTKKTFRSLGLKHQVCPFELSLDILNFVDVVIGDYNYVFAPYGCVTRLTPTTASKKRKSNLIIDEVHNLPSRANEYQSKSLSTKNLEDLRALVAPAFFSQASILIDKIQGQIKNTGSRDGLVELDHQSFFDLQDQVGHLLSQYLRTDLEIGSKDPIISLSREITDWCLALENSSGPHFFITRRTQGTDVILKVTCCDASLVLKEIYKFFRSVVGFSATLKPFEYYAKLCGFDSQKLEIAEFKSPFSKHRRKILVIPQISTKWQDRDSNAQKIAQVIARIAARKKGHYFAFFPSYQFLYQVSRLIELPDFEVIEHPREAKAYWVNDLLEKLKTSSRPILFCTVQGGVFSEGVDYPGDMLIGAFVVGPGLPTFDSEREQMRKYFETQYGSGFDYAYTYPAMTKVVQSAGRVIRRPEDKGLIVLLDRRFASQNYVKSMPTDWFENSVQDLISSEIIKSVDEFWQRMDDES